MDTFSLRNIPKPKTILHIDGDAFFVGVEIAKNPRLKGLPVVTGEERGIVSALSYEAKALGVVRGMPIFRLKKAFPQVIILSGDYASYVRYSGLMFDIVRRYADDVEEYSIDECFADLTGLERTLKMTYREIAERIKTEVTDELGLSVSLGIGPTKILSKVASKWIKPNGLTVIDRDSIAIFLEKTPIGKIWGIGPKTSMSLNKMHIQTAGDFIKKDLAWVRATLSKPYEVIWQELNGIPVMQIDPRQKTVYSSIQKTRSFHPSTNDKTFLLSQLSKHIEDACTKARHYKLVPRKVSFFLKTRNFEYVTRTVSLTSPTNAPEVILAMLHGKFRSMHVNATLYRTTGVVLHELISGELSQSDLFGSTDKIHTLEAIHEQIDALESRYGRRIVHLGSTHNALKQEQKGTDADEVERNLLFL